MNRNLIRVLINSAEKAANIARKIREDQNLLELLIEKKSSEEANPRFVEDFKTLADVLIQETIRNDVGILFPELEPNIRGEETAKFTNSLGESIYVKIGLNIEETATVLEKVLNGNRQAAEILAEQVHQNVDVDSNFDGIPELPENFDYSKIGIWIDPIDATSEYIKGDSIFSSFPGISSTGLDCVTVLIGVYNDDGNPIIGIVNQPFFEKLETNVYKSKIFWGIHLNEIKANNLGEIESRSISLGVFSSSENPKILDMVKKLKYEIVFSAGAGHKALVVVKGDADFYLLSKGSTFFWDTCGPQAILSSLNGGMFDFRKSIESKQLISLKYSDVNEKCNKGGIIVVRDMEVGKILLETLINENH